MDILRRNTDYAVRLMVNLARRHGNGAASTRALAEAEGVSYDLACKLMQRLHAAKLVASRMGPTGGFQLACEPAKVSVLAVVEAIQGPVCLNRCLVSDAACPRQTTCPLRVKLVALQEQMERYLGGVTLDELAQDSHRAGKGKRSQRRRT